MSSLLSKDDTPVVSVQEILDLHSDKLSGHDLKTKVSANPPLNEAEIQTSNSIIAILNSYSPPTQTPIFRPIFEETVRELVRQKLPLHIVLPAFPFKSPNRKNKVVGILPDLGEEMALARLEGLCLQLEKIYPDVELTIVSDGLVYNDLLKVSDAEVYNYGTELRKLAARNCPHVSFARLSSLIHDVPEPKNLEEYVTYAPMYRDRMAQEYMPKDFEVSKELESNPNALMTYRGYIKFLQMDLKHEETRQGLSGKQVKKMNEAVAKRMIERGAAFSAAVQQTFPSSVRISIHPSVSPYKKPIALLPGQGDYTTPWHCSCAMELDGSLTYAHSETFLDSPDYELVSHNYRPYFFRRKSDLYNWDKSEVDIMPIYPCGLRISPKKFATAKMVDIDMQKVRVLAEIASPIVLRGFQETNDLELFKEKAKEMGIILPWKFGEVLVVKDAGGNSGGLNNVLSAEPMPFHFDGLFKTQTVIQDGLERLVPQPPQFQFFTVVTPSPKDSGLTLVSSSKILFELLPKPYSLSQLQKLTWSVETTAFDNTKMKDLDLVVPHPTTSAPCLRYHEPWLQDKTAFDPTIVHIENGGDVGDELLGVLDDLLYDRRVCYYHAWQQGDLIVSDNISMMHTRTGFKPGFPRELWRIHVE